jgi:hypothetical protein
LLLLLVDGSLMRLYSSLANFILRLAPLAVIRCSSRFGAENSLVRNGHDTYPFSMG